MISPLFDGNYLPAALPHLPFVDTHSHTLPPFAEKAPSLASLLLSLAARPTFLSAGFPSDLANDIAAGRTDGEVKSTMLSFWPLVSSTSVMQAILQGLQAVCGLRAGPLSAETYDALEEALPAFSLTDWALMANRHNLRSILINPGNSAGADFAIRRAKGLDPAFDRLFALVPTFDAHALHPTQDATKRAAAFLGLPLSTLPEYLLFVEAYLDFFLAHFPIAGLKISEQYFRRLHFVPRPLEEASALYALGGESLFNPVLLDFITLHVFFLAEKRGLTIQLHTGMLWGEPNTQSVHPADLCQAARHLPGVKLDLLHLGFPHLGEAAAMALNAPNISLNLSWLPLISEDLTVDWLIRLLQMVPVSKLTLGTDVFDQPTLLGTAALVRRVVARAAAHFPGQEEEISRRLLYQNAEALYKL